jgi:glucose-1-phosphate cytidylyltransferase
MKAVILAGGLGTRLSEETAIRPKPMVEIGGKPLLWHILKAYSHHGVDDFIICLGYKGYVIKEFFANYLLHSADVTFCLKHDQMQIHDRTTEPWQITLVDTGDTTQTGGRLKRVSKYLEGEDTFCLTYGDGVSDVDISASIAFHHQQNALATMTAVQPAGRWGALDLDGHRVTSFREKPAGDRCWINGGFFVLSSAILDYIDGDTTVWERGPLERLAEEGNLNVFQHTGFWQAMDTLRDKQYLESLWQSGETPWKKW